MMIEEPSIFFSDFASEASFEKKDGSFADTLPGIYEEGTTEEDGGPAEMISNSSQVTVENTDAVVFGEGDFVTCLGVRFEILDVIADAGQVTFLLSPVSGIAGESSFMP